MKIEKNSNCTIQFSTSCKKIIYQIFFLFKKFKLFNEKNSCTFDEHNKIRKSLRRERENDKEIVQYI